MSAGSSVHTSAATHALVHHVRSLDYAALDADAIAAIKTFVLDTIGVAVSGSAAAFAAEMRSGLADWLGESEATVLGTGERVSAGTAAALNGFHAHCQEFDCVHEGAVVHPLATIQPAVLAWSERTGRVQGRDLMAALVAGVDVSTTIGMASHETLRFFRPATAGIFGSTAAIAKLAKLSDNQFNHAMGLALAQCAGTMQAHEEGLCTLAVQIGLAARAAIQAVDFAASGMPGPRNWLEGPHGYLPLFEGRFDVDAVVASLSSQHRICQVSHKPFPSGRATHAAVDALLQLRASGLRTDAIQRVDIFVPPLINKLVGRPVHANMGVNYARLCLQYVSALALNDGEIKVTDYEQSRLNDPVLLTLAERVHIHVDDNPDPNALNPQRVAIALNDGEIKELTITHTLGSPENPLTRNQNLTKFRTNWQHAAVRLDTDVAEDVIGKIDRLEDLRDVRDLTAVFCP